MKHTGSRVLWLQVDCCGECETEEDPESAEFGEHVDAHAECQGTGGVFAIDGSSMLEEDLVATRQYKPVAAKSDVVNSNVWVWRGDLEIVEREWQASDSVATSNSSGTNVLVL